MTNDADDGCPDCDGSGYVYYQGWDGPDPRDEAATGSAELCETCSKEAVPGIF